MTVAELIEWLKTQDQGATVEIVVHLDDGDYYSQGGTASTEDFDPSEHVEYTDFRGNRFVTPDQPWHNQRTLLLGVYRG